MGAQESVTTCFVILVFLCSSSAAAIIRNYEFNVTMLSITRLCTTKNVVTVNGQFPGPEIHADEGDRVLIRVNNLSPHNITIHWHGVRQIRSGWFDGPAYITQCPIQPGDSFLYNFTTQGQTGTLWWHAHIAWLRATVHGAFIIHPREEIGFPFQKPDKEVTLVLGEYWKEDEESIISQALSTGATPNNSDAFTINSWPGPLYTNCSLQNEAYVLEAWPSQVYLLRIINAALNNDMFLAVASHKLTVVEADATYVKPFSSDYIIIAPGQTMNVLLKLDQTNGAYYIAASPYSSAPNVPFDNTTTSAILTYSNISSSPILPKLPLFNDTASATAFDSQLRKLNTIHNPISVPLEIDQHLFYTVGFGVKKCNKKACQGPKGGMMRASFNNVSFVRPKKAILESHYRKTQGVYTTDFPSKPVKVFNFTGSQLKNLNPRLGTQVKAIPYGARVELILQDTNVLVVESHPIHLHGYNFYIVGSGFGNYNASASATFNLVDPPERNTVRVPVGGWAAIRFTANNPGVWFMHCHLEVHATWGLETVFLVSSGAHPLQQIDPPPADLPRC